MKNSIVILCAAFALAGCSESDRGGSSSTGDQTGYGSASSTNMQNAPSSSVTEPQGGATTPGGLDSGSITNTNSAPSNP